MAESLKTEYYPPEAQNDGRQRANPEQLETILKKSPESQRAKDLVTGK
jgi:hypothetical protein